MAENKFIPRRAVEFFRRKGLKETDHWTDLWHGEHARFFTVARSTYADILNDVHSEVEKALTEGTTLKEFKDNLRPILQKKGWWGKAKDGVQLGSDRRLETMYNIPLRTAYAAGYWENIQEAKSYFPYLRYAAVRDEKTREQHRQFNNLVLPVDDPFWLKFYPPNGWGCRCTVIQMSETDLKRDNLSIGKSPKIQEREWVNRKTGEVQKVPVGIDPGFDYNVGVSNLREKSRQHVAQKMGVINPKIAQNTINQLVKSEDFKDFYNNPQGYYSVGVVDDTIQQAIKSKTKIALLSDETLLKNKAKHPEFGIEDYLLIGDVLGEYDLLVQDSDNSVVAIKEMKDKKYWVAIKTTRKQNEIFTQTFHITNKRQIEKLIDKGKRLK